MAPPVASPGQLHVQRLEIERGVQRRFQIDLTPKSLLADEQLPPSLPGKLQQFDELPLHDAIARLEKFAKRKFTLKDRQEWDHYLTAETAKLVRVKREIADAMQDLNEQVYRLFHLTAEEIKVLAREVEH